MRHPEHQAIDRDASEVERLPRPRDVGHDEAGLAAEEVDREILDGLGAPAEQVEQRQDRRCLRRALQRVHARLGRAQALRRTPAAHRQVQDHQAEFVAEFPDPLGRAQVDGHHRAHGRAIDVDVASLQVGAQRTGHGRDEHVVDLGAERHADGLDVVERDGFRPRDPLLHAELALERGLGVRRLEEFGREHRDTVEDHGGLRERLLRMHDRVETGAEPGKGVSRSGRDGVQSERDRAVGPRVAGGRRRGCCGRGHRRVAGRVEQVPDHRHHPGPVAQAVVDADDEGAAAIDAVDDVRLPERSLAIERRGGQVADQVRQCRLVVRRRERDVMQLLLDREVRHVLPAWGCDRKSPFDHALAKASESRQARIEDRLHSREGERLAREDNAGDLREVHRPVDVKPRHIGGRHRLCRHALRLRGLRSRSNPYSGAS